MSDGTPGRPASRLVRTRNTVSLTERFPEGREWARARLATKVDQSAGPDACHPWMLRDGTPAPYYGRFREINASRVAYWVATGEDPGDLLVCHRCDNPPCCNPAHLFLGDAYANQHDAIAKGRWSLTGLEFQAGAANPRAGAASRLTDDQRLHIGLLWEQGVPRKEIAQRFQIGEGDVYRVAHELGGRSPWQRAGLRTGNTKLTDAQVQEVRALLTAGDSTMSAIARRFGVSHGLVSKIRLGGRGGDPIPLPRRVVPVKVSQPAPPPHRLSVAPAPLPEPARSKAKPAPPQPTTRDLVFKILSEGTPVRRAELIARTGRSRTGVKDALASLLQDGQVSRTAVYGVYLVASVKMNQRDLRRLVTPLPRPTAGEASEATARGQILAQLRAHTEELPPIRLQELTGKSKSSVRDQLRTLLEEGLIQRGADGYSLVRDAVSAA